MMLYQRVLAAGLGLVFLWGSAHGRWEVAEEAGPLTVAQVRNDDGHHLRVYLAADGQLMGQFRLRPGLQSLDPDACPTLAIDQREPLSTAQNDDPCQAQAGQVDFALAEVRGEVVRSPVLHGLMSGRRIRFIYKLKGLGYRETGFSLRQSRRSILQAIGKPVTVRAR